MKKNVIAIVAAVALVILAVPTIAFANGMQQTWCPADGSGSLAHHAMRAAGDSDAAATVGAAIATVRGEYVDLDNNGVCDNYADGQAGCTGYIDADNNGVCDNYGTGAHHGCGAGNGTDTGNGGGSGYGAGNGGGHHGCMRR